MWMLDLQIQVTLYLLLFGSDGFPYDENSVLFKKVHNYIEKSKILS